MLKYKLFAADYIKKNLFKIYFYIRKEKNNSWNVWNFRQKVVNLENLSPTDY